MAEGNPSENERTAKGIYARLQADREPYLRRARTNAALTLPHLILPEGEDKSQDLEDPFQSKGAEGVNNLSAKIVFATFPPDGPLFKLQLDGQAEAELETAAGTDEMGKKAKLDVEGLMVETERTVVATIHGSNFYSQVPDAVRHLIVAGNVCLEHLSNGDWRLHRMDSYVLRRSGNGEVVEAVIKQQTAFVLLPDEAKAKVQEKDPNIRSTANVDIYTHIWLTEPGAYEYHQEVEGEVVDGSEGRYRAEDPTFIFARWNATNGDHWSRAYIDDFRGDLTNLENLSGALTEGAMGAARLLWLVDPSGLTDVKDVAEAPNLSVLAGRNGDVGALQAEKFGDFRVAADRMMELERRLDKAFLLTGSVTRDAERVTAEEIRRLASELEDALGGVFALLARELQLPVIRATLAAARSQGVVPPWPEGMVEPVVVAGMEALGRGHALARFQQWYQNLVALVGEEQMAQRVRLDNIDQFVSNAIGIDTTGFIMSEEQYQRLQLARSSQQLAEKLGPEAIRQLGGTITGAAEEPQGQPQG